MRPPLSLPLAAALAAALAACSGGAPGADAKGGAAGVGAKGAVVGADGAGRSGSGVAVQLVSPGLKKALRASADGAWLAWLDRCAEVGGPFLPPGTSSCELSLAPSAGGAATAVARGVTSLPHGFGFAPEGGVLAALAGYDHAAGAGALVLARGPEVREVARGATFHGFLPDGAGLLLVAGGSLSLVTPGGEPRAVAGATGVASFDAAPGPWGRREVAVLLRRPASAGGGLLALGPDLAAPRLVAERSRDFGLGRGGAWAFTRLEAGGAVLHLGRGSRSAPVARGARSFEFSPDGAMVAWVSEAAPGVQGDLHLVPAAGPAGNASGPALAVQVGEHRWARASPRLAWLERYDPRSRSGVLGTGGPGLATRTFGAGVTDFELSPDGSHLAFLRHTTERGYSVDLELVETMGAATAISTSTPISTSTSTPTSTPTPTPTPASTPASNPTSTPTSTSTPASTPTSTSTSTPTSTPTPTPASTPTSTPTSTSTSTSTPTSTSASASTSTSAVADLPLPSGERAGVRGAVPTAAAQPPRPVRGRVVARGVFGFTFSPDGRWLYYRTRCTRQAEACDLERLPTAGPPDGKPEELAQGVKSFEFDPRDPGRLLITWQRPDLVALDVAVWQGGRLIAVDRGALPGSVRFLGPDSRRVAYAVVEPKRAGVYVATLPAE